MTRRSHDGKIRSAGVGQERIVVGASVAFAGALWAAAALGASIVVTALAATFTFAVLMGLLVRDRAERRHRRQAVTEAVQAGLRDVPARRDTDAAKREGEALLNGIADAGPDGTTGFMGRNALGLPAFDSPEEAIGRNVAEIRPLEARRDVVAALAPAGSASRFRTDAAAAAGRPLHLALAVSPVAGAEGRPDRLLVLSRAIGASMDERGPEERLLAPEHARIGEARPSAETLSAEGEAKAALADIRAGDRRLGERAPAVVSSGSGPGALTRGRQSFPPWRAAHIAVSGPSDTGTEGPRTPPGPGPDAPAAAGEEEPGRADEQDHGSGPGDLPDGGTGDMHRPQGVVETTARGAQGAARILLVEDADINQRLAAALLEAVGHVVDVVADGALAVTAVAEKAYDVVLMDVRMPGMDGVTATRLIRLSDGPHRDVPIIAMTANVFPEQIEAFRAAGMNDHVGKPLHRVQLYAAVSRWTAGTAAAAPVAPGGDGPAQPFDEAAFRQLALYLGPARLGDVLARFALSLSQRFGEGEATPENLQRWKADAHVVQSIAGMTGFIDLAWRCRALHAARPGSERQETLLAAVREAREATLPRIAKLREDLAAGADLAGSAACVARAPG